MSERPLLSVVDLRVDGVAAEGLSFDLEAGGRLALVGAGAGAVVLAPLRLEPLSAGRVTFDGQDLTALRERRLRVIRGGEIGAVLAHPADSLHPSYRLSWQLTEAVRAHNKISKAAARDRAIDLLEAVGVPGPRRAVDAYPRALPVDVRLRALIAMAVINRPRLLLVDDPLRGFDAASRGAIVALLGELHRRLGFALLLATEDPQLARELAADALTLQ